MRIFRSDAFAARHDPEAQSDSEFVQTLFRITLGRDPDGAGHDEYVRQLAEKAITRENVVLGLLTSSEFAARYENATE